MNNLGTPGLFIIKNIDVYGTWKIVNSKWQ
jgi:hypothetical protein